VRRVLLVVKRDYFETVKNKGFLVGMVLFPVLFGGAFPLIALLNNPNTKEQHVAILDHSGMAAAAVIAAAEQQNTKDMFDKTTGRQMTPRYVFETVAPDKDGDAQRLAHSDRVRAGELAMFVEIGAEVVRGGEQEAPQPICALGDVGGLCPTTPPEHSVTYYGNSSGQDNLRGWLDGPIINAIRRVRLSESGLSSDRTDGVLANIAFERMSLMTRDSKTGEIQAPRRRNMIEGFAIPFALVFILLMVVMVGSAPMLGAIAQDKMERVYEMMLVSASPMEIMAGKVMSALGLSLTSSTFYIVAGIVGLQAMALAGLIAFSLLPWFFVYLVCNVLMLAGLGAALGSACSTPQDAQSLAGFLIFPIVIPSVMMPVIMDQPNGTVATIMSFIPPFTPMLMLLRQAMPSGIPAWQPWAGLAGILLFTFFTVWGASRVFRIGILMQGKPPHLGEILRWAIKG